MLNDSYEHACNIGKIVSNLQSLEFVLRAFLLEALGASNKVNYQHLNIGDLIPEDAFTNWDTMAQLIKKYNSRVLPIDHSLAIDESIVVLRDALAHGRISAASSSGPSYLLKFSNPQNQLVKVEFAALMDKAWFKAQVGLTHEQVVKVLKAGKRLGMSMFSDS